MAHLEEVIRRINPHLIRYLSFDAYHIIRKIPLQDLLSPYRFDVMAKYLYAKHHKLGYDLSWATELYREHLRVWGGFKEADGSGKNCFQDYLIAFNRILDDISINGFDETTSLLPIGNHGIIIDGAHRAAACLAYGKEPTAVVFTHDEAHYSSQFFLNAGLPSMYLDAMAIEYAKLQSNSFVVCLFPVAISKIDEVRKLLDAQGHIVHIKQAHYSNNGPVNLIAQLYKGEAWLGQQERGWPGAKSHVEEKFKYDAPVTFFLFEDKSNQVRSLKERIRALYKLGNHSVHINDTHEETIRIAEQVFNDHSIDFMNNANLCNSYRVHQFHQSFLNEIQERNYPVESYCVDGSAVLALHGIRDAADYDFLSISDLYSSFSHPLIHCHNDQLKYYSDTLGQLIFNPANFFYYDGVKYQTLLSLEKMKTTRDEKKDRDDLRLIAAFERSDKKRLHRLRNAIGFRAFVRKIYKKFMPHFLQLLLKKCIRKIKLFREYALYIIELLKRDELSISYLGFKVHYSPGNSLIRRISGGRIYEPEVTTAIIRALRSISHPTIVDIGANIGLMSLNINKFYPSSIIYAFEPGPLQAGLLLRTIQDNNLESRILVSEIALCDQLGLSDYSSHGMRHNSGDGFKDTERAGPTKKIKVKTQTLDFWWQAQNYPVVNLIKMDTEGSELLIIKGGRKLLLNQRPIIVFELFSKNLAPYKYTPHDVLNELYDLNYKVKTLDGSEVNHENIIVSMTSHDTFMAIHEEGE